MHSFRALRLAQAVRLDWLRSTFVIVALGVATTTVASTVQLPSASAAPLPTAAYVSVQPCRLADTRLNSGFARIDSTTLQVAARGVCGIPANATSLALTLTVDRPQAAGFLTAWPANQTRPVVSNLNFNAGQIRANSSITRVDSTGAFRVFTSIPSQVVVDVVGAFVPATTSAAGRFVPRPSTRLFDSRDGAKLSAGASTTLPLPAGVPADAIALALNVTVTESAGPGFVTEFPAGMRMPTSSILNVDQAGQTRAAAGIFPVSSAGVVLFISGGGHIVVDLLGYFTGASAGSGTDGLYTAYDPTRLLDTRDASPLGTGVPLYPGGGLELAASQGGSMAYNVTSVSGSAGFVTAYPAGTARPTTSTVNSVGGGDIVANFAITQVSNRGLGFFSQSQTHLVADLEGWFSGPSASATQSPPVNTPPPAPQQGYSTCTTDGLSALNSTRAAVGVAPLASNPAAAAFACTWALELASNPATFAHSATAPRDAAVGCPTGENIAAAGGTSPTTLISLWYGSAPHMANIKNPIYGSGGLGFVIRTDPNGAQTIYGVTVFALC
ncbi:MAG: CAP domain-containing protein [Ilumatobacteraceae bacterium]